MRLFYSKLILTNSLLSREGKEFGAFVCVFFGSFDKEKCSNAGRKSSIKLKVILFSTFTNFS